jgi:hypothetical protein
MKIRIGTAIPQGGFAQTPRTPRERIGTTALRGHLRRVICIQNLTPDPLSVYREGEKNIYLRRGGY